tara:strand:+ start:301 stop:696 length:396 start_codon:yes stop_codon:yes gene_type:complete
MTRKRDKIDALLTDAVDGETSNEVLNVLKESDLQEEFETADSVRTLLAGVESEPVPNQFVAKVTQRVRRRTGGRYFHPADRPFGMLVSIDAFIVLAVAVMAACWFLLNPAVDVPAERVDFPPKIEAPKGTP